MKRTGYLVMLAGVLVAALGSAQLAWAIWTSPDPNPNNVGSGMLMAASWYAGCALFSVGALLGGVVPRRWPWL